MEIPLLKFQSVRKTYINPQGGEQIVLDQFDLSIAKEEFVSVIGHSGCGKTTALMMAAGLVEHTDGLILVAGKEISGPGPDRGVVFQAPSLMPWMTALDNVLLGVNQVFPKAT